MKQLEIKTYTRQEIADITNTDINDKKFARKVRNILTNWGYSLSISAKALILLNIQRPQ